MCIIAANLLLVTPPKQRNSCKSQKGHWLSFQITFFHHRWVNDFPLWKKAHNRLTIRDRIQKHDQKLNVHLTRSCLTQKVVWVLQDHIAEDQTQTLIHIYHSEKDKVAKTQRHLKAVTRRYCTESHSSISMKQFKVHFLIIEGKISEVLQKILPSPISPVLATSIILSITVST